MTEQLRLGQPFLREETTGWLGQPNGWADKPIAIQPDFCP
jgi:hypothetical protein